MTLRTLGLALLLATAASQAALAAVARDGQVVMGTVLTVTIVAQDAAAAERLARAAIEEARYWDDALTIWRPEGELARFNRAAGQGDAAVGPRLEDGLRAMLRLSHATGGAFEPAVGALPDKGDATVRLVGIRQALSMDGHQARLKAGTVLDPGGIGKGIALDAMSALVLREGASAAFFDFGGSSQTGVGVPPGDASGWSVLVAGMEDGSSLGVVHLRNASLSTSKAGAQDTKPILDPRSARPVPIPRLVTVRSRSATDADAWSTALVVLGREGVPMARKSGLEVLLEDREGLAVTAAFGLKREERRDIGK